jgi:AraC-like DNA-binding protein
MDSLSDVLSLLKPRTGDGFLLPRGRPFRLASDTTLTPIDARTIFFTARNGGIASCNGCGDVFLIGGHFTLTGNHAGILLRVLPLKQQPGGFQVAQHLAYMMQLQALRLHLAEGLRGGVGWLFALADKQRSSAINSMHDDPAHRWTLQELAERAGMSRSTFALKFKETVGASPMEYLTRWRMLLAGDRLANIAEAGLRRPIQMPMGSRPRRAQTCAAFPDNLYQGTMPLLSE